MCVLYLYDVGVCGNERSGSPQHSKEYENICTRRNFRTFAIPLAIPDQQGMLLLLYMYYYDYYTD